MIMSVTGLIISGACMIMSGTGVIMSVPGMIRSGCRHLNAQVEKKHATGLIQAWKMSEFTMIISKFSYKSCTGSCMESYNKHFSNEMCDMTFRGSIFGQLDCCRFLKSNYQFYRLHEIIVCYWVLGV